MNQVKTEILIPSRDIQAVWNVVAGFEKYPEMMASVLEVRQLERNAEFGVSEWTVLLNGTELSWTERDVFEPYGRISFESIDGDLEVFQGTWTLQQLDEDVRVELAVEFDIGIPSLAEVLNPVGAKAIGDNAGEMLSTIKDQMK